MYAFGIGPYQWGFRFRPWYPERQGLPFCRQGFRDLQAQVTVSARPSGARRRAFDREWTKDTQNVGRFYPHVVISLTAVSLNTADAIRIAV